MNWDALTGLLIASIGTTLTAAAILTGGVVLASRGLARVGHGIRVRGTYVFASAWGAMILTRFFTGPDVIRPLTATALLAVLLGAGVWLACRIMQMRWPRDI